MTCSLRSPRSPRRLVVSAVCAALVLTNVTGCGSRSPEELVAAVSDLPGVVSAAAADNGGDNDIPFATVPLNVTVRMDADSSVADVLAVFDRFSDDVDGGRVCGVDVALVGRKASLATGCGIHVTEAMVQDLVLSAQQPDVVRYRREAFPVLPLVEITYANRSFAQLVQTSDHYRDVGGIEDVELDSGPFVVDRDAGNGSGTLADAQAQLVLRLQPRFRLTGALVDSRGPLELGVRAGDAAALKALLAGDPPARALGRIVVRTHGRGS